MIKKYLKNAVERRIVIPPHPHYSRSVVIDDVVTPLNTYEDTPYDLIDLGSPVSVTDQIKAGLTLKPMGSRPDSTGLEAAHVAAAFVNQFNALGVHDSASSTVHDSASRTVQDSASENSQETITESNSAN